MRELHAGESVTLPLAPLRVALTGIQPQSGVALRITQDGAPAQVFWQSNTEAIIPPVQRDLSVVVEGVDGALIPPGSRVGVTISVEGGSGTDQVTVSPEDVGAKRSVVYATVQVLQSGTTVSIGELVGGAGAASAQDIGWVGPGAYAFREAFSNATPDSALPWVFALDGSVSMMRALDSQIAIDRIATVAGIVQEWMRRPPKALMYTSVREPVAVPVGPDYAADLVHAVSGNSAPASWLHLEPVIMSAAQVLTSGGVVVAVVDGVPADVDRTLDALNRHPQLDLRLVVSGSSALGLPSDPSPEWFSDDLAMLADLAERAVIVAMSPTNPAPSFVELARLLAGPDSLRSLA